MCTGAPGGCYESTRPGPTEGCGHLLARATEFVGSYHRATRIKKTPVMNRILKLLHHVEAVMRQRYAKTMTEYKEACTKAAKDKKEEPPKPPMPCLMVNDATPEALHEALRENPAGLFSVQDEYCGWLGNMQKPGREGERGFYLASWNGDTPHQLKRIGRGTIDVPAACLSMLGGIQPARLKFYLEGGAGGVSLMDDGLLQRIQIAVWPNKYAGKYVDRAPKVMAEWRVQRIINMLTEADPANPVVMKFAPDAQELFVEWFIDLEGRLASEELNPLLAQYLSKYRSLMPTIAALFELAEWADEVAPKSLINTIAEESVGFVGCRTISHVNAARAIRWCRYLESHARRISGLTARV